MLTNPLVKSLVSTSLAKYLTGGAFLGRNFIKFEPADGAYILLAKPWVAAGDFDIEAATMLPVSAANYAVLGQEADTANYFKLLSTGYMSLSIDSSVVTSTVLATRDSRFRSYGVTLSGNDFLFTEDGTIIDTVTDAAAAAKTLTLDTIAMSNATEYFDAVMANAEFNQIGDLLLLALNEPLEDIEYPVGNVLGSELWINPADIIATGWTDNGGGSYTHTGTSSEIRTTRALVEDDPYVCRVIVAGAGRVQIRLGGPSSNGKNLSPYLSVGTHTIVLNAEGTDVLSAIRFISADEVTVSDISVKNTSNAALYKSISTNKREVYELINADWLAVESVTNGGFSIDADWSKGSGVTISDGLANSNGALPAFSTMLSQVSLDVGVRYKYSYETINQSSGSAQLKLGSNGQGVTLSSGAYIGIDIAEGNTSIRMATVAVPFTADIDNISARKILEQPWQGVRLAHRGYTIDTPENTMSAFNNALALKTKNFETDVQITSDGVYVLLHDPTIDRTSNGTGAISSLTYAEADAFDYGSWFSASFVGERIPRFDDFCAFADTNGCTIFTEIKTSMTTLEISGMIDIIVANNLINNCVILSFTPSVLATVRGINASLTLGYLSSTLIDINAMLPNSYALIAVDVLLADVGYIKTAQDQGIKVGAWTVNDQNRFNLLANADVDTIILENRFEHT